MTDKKSDNSTRGESDPLTTIMRRYSRWRREQILTMSKLSMRQLSLRTAYITGCILVDGVVLPWIIVALERTFLSYLLFSIGLVLVLIMQVTFYNRWKRGWM